jgi:hypothetical protein
MTHVFIRIYSLSIEALVPEICAIFCWQVMKMCHLFLTSGSYVERPQMIKMKTYLVYTV